MSGGNFESDRDDFDSQDQSETLDESNTVGDGDRGEVRSFADADERYAFEDLPGVEDVTEAMGDRDDDEALALDADEFDPEAITDADLEADDEDGYRAATDEHQDDLDGLGRQDGGFDEARLAMDEVEGQDEVRDAAEAQGGEDDSTDYQADAVSDADLRDLGYLDTESDAKGG